MRLLLDTHALLWWAHEPEELSKTVLQLLTDTANDILVSAVSAMEIATKQRRGRLEYDSPLATRFLPSILEFGFEPLSVNCDHAERAGNLRSQHQDPWDRLLVAQAEIERVALVSRDDKLRELDVTTIW